VVGFNLTEGIKIFNFSLLVALRYALFNDQASSVGQREISVFIAKDVLMCLVVSEVVGIVVKAKADLKQGFRLDQPRAVIAKAFFQGASVMFQYPVNRFDSIALLALDAVIVLVLAARVTKFLVYPAFEWLPTVEAGRRYRHGSFHHISFADQK